MSYSDDLTEEKLKNLTNELSNLYKKATNEAIVVTSDYLLKFEDRDEKLKEELKDKEAYKAKYCVGASAYMTPEQHYKQWRLAQIGRGKRWKAVQDDVAKRILTANQEAEGIINSTLPGIYADNHNFSAYEIEKQSGIAFNILNEGAVTELNTGVNHTEFRTVKVNPTRDYNWNSKRIQSALTAGLLQGKSIPRLTEDFMQVMGSNKAAAIRNARTAVTSAQAAGRVQAYKEAEEMGIELQKEWLSAHDARVRDSHANLDGVRVGMDEVFPNGCRYPADPEGKPAEVYNCRCTLKAILPKYNGKVRTNNTVQNYNEWIEGKTNNHLKMDLQYFARPQKRKKVPNDNPLWDALVKGDIKTQKEDVIFSFEHGGYDYIIEYIDDYKYNIISCKKKPNIHDGRYD